MREPGPVAVDDRESLARERVHVGHVPDDGRVGAVTLSRFAGGVRHAWLALVRLEPIE
jgi:hypothetical protein